MVHLHHHEWYFPFSVFLSLFRALSDYSRHVGRQRQSCLRLRRHRLHGRKPHRWMALL